MPRMRTRLSPAAAAVTAMIALLLAACTGGADDPGEAPEAEQLLAAAADEMAEVETAAISLDVTAPLEHLPVTGVSGVITREGEAEGSAQVEQLGQQLELQFVVVDEVFHYQLLGPWAQMPLGDAQVLYDPTAVLDPDRGLANVLRTATDPEVVEQADGEYEVDATFSAEALEVLLPGAFDEDVAGTVWIGADQPLLHRAEFPVEGAQPTALQVALSDFDEPVTISAP